MQTDAPDPSRDSSSVRLTWAPPTPRKTPRPEGDPVPAPAPAPKHARALPAGRSAPTASGPATGVPRVALVPAEVPAPAAASGGSALQAAVAPPAAPAAASAEREPEPHLGRAFADAFDRLSDRLLERLRSLRQDVDADLAAVRAELAGVRQAVDAVGDRVQVRHIRTTLDEVNAEVIALRRAVLEWPELEQVALDVAAVRGDMAFLFSTSGGERPGAAPSELLGELQHLVANLAGEVRRLGGSGPAAGDPALLAEVASIRAELSALRRRPLAPAGRLEDDQLDWLAAAVAERVADQLAGREHDGGATRGRGLEVDDDFDRQFGRDADREDGLGRRRRRR